MAENSFKSFINKAWAFIKRVAKRVWEYLKVAKMEWIVMIALFALDLITKSIVMHTVSAHKPVVLIPNFLQINYTTNYNAAYGASFIRDMLGDVGARIFFSAFAVAASVAFILILIRNKGKNKIFRIGIAMFVAGAMGNCIDRMFLGYVRDFVHFSFQPYIFNIADAELIFGVVLIVIFLLFFFHDSDKKAHKAATEKSDGATGEVQPENNDKISESKSPDVAEIPTAVGTDGEPENTVAEGGGSEDESLQSEDEAPADETDNTDLDEQAATIKIPNDTEGQS